MLLALFNNHIINNLAQFTLFFFTIIDCKVVCKREGCVNFISLDLREKGISTINIYIEYLIVR